MCTHMDMHSTTQLQAYKGVCNIIHPDTKIDTVSAEVEVTNR